jgi:hypothetical protein
MCYGTSTKYEGASKGHETSGAFRLYEIIVESEDGVRYLLAHAKVRNLDVTLRI